MRCVAVETESSPVHHHGELADLMRKSYSSGDLDAIERLLCSEGTLDFPTTRRGLFPAAILPAECVDRDPSRNRRYDAALLFLIYPLEVVGGSMAEQILDDVSQCLQGRYGIRRYLGDSFWCADYKLKVPSAKRTVSYVDNLAVRDALREKGREAQWCIFDPIVSAIYGRRYQRHGRKADLWNQVRYLNRSLAQITGWDGPSDPLRCPELYYMEGDRWVPNDATPLLWTQANLLVALRMMRDSLRTACSG